MSKSLFRTKTNKNQCEVRFQVPSSSLTRIPVSSGVLPFLSSSLKFEGIGRLDLFSNLINISTDIVGEQ